MRIDSCRAAPPGRRRAAWLLPALFLLLLPVMAAAQNAADYRLGPGDVVRISVYNNPDLTTEAQITQAGRINFPLLGEVEIGGLDKGAAEARLAQLLEEGKFVVKPRVNVLVSQYRSQQVSVLGQVNKPGRIPMETPGNLTDVLALAGGISANGSDSVIVISKDKEGRTSRREVDLNALMHSGQPTGNLPMGNGDILYVPRAPLFYIYGEVQRPGAYRLERDMTVMQALAVGGGLSVRGTQRGVRLHRRDSSGTIQALRPGLNDSLQADDVVFVRESLF